MTARTDSPDALPPGQRIYAVGDVHGCADRLAALHRQIAEHLIANPIDDPLLLHVGDYIDRGPDSAGVLDRLLGPPPVPGLPVVNLKGNHEAMFLAALADAPDAVLHWCNNGGEATLDSWHIPRHADPSDWAALIPPRQLDLLRSLPLTHQAGMYVFVHAGIRPGIPLERQTEEDLLWIREPFLRWSRPFGVTIVHGHTPSPEPQLRTNRIGIDTGAVMGGPLTCVILETDHLAFISA